MKISRISTILLVISVVFVLNLFVIYWRWSEGVDGRMSELPLSSSKLSSVGQYISQDSLGDAGRVNEFTATVEPKTEGLFSRFSITGDSILPRLLRTKVIREHSRIGASEDTEVNVEEFNIGKKLQSGSLATFLLDRAILSIIKSEINIRLTDEFFKANDLAPALTEFRSEVFEKSGKTLISISGPGGTSTMGVSNFQEPNSDPGRLEKIILSRQRNRRDKIGISRFMERLPEFMTPGEQEQFFPADLIAKERGSCCSSQLKKEFVAFLRSKARIQIEQPKIIEEAKEYSSSQHVKQEETSLNYELAEEFFETEGLFIELDKLVVATSYDPSKKALIVTIDGGKIGAVKTSLPHIVSEPDISSERIQTAINNW